MNTIVAIADSADIVFLIFKYIMIIKICEITILTCKKFIQFSNPTTPEKHSTKKCKGPWGNPDEELINNDFRASEFKFPISHFLITSYANC